MATTTDTDTELSAVNSILGSIGQSPVTTLGVSTIDNNITAYANPEISFIYNILTEVNKDVQNEGWHFNTEYHVKLTPDANKNILLPTKTLRYDLHESEDRTKDVVSVLTEPSGKHSAPAKRPTKTTPFGYALCIEVKQE